MYKSSWLIAVQISLTNNHKLCRVFMARAAKFKTNELARDIHAERKFTISAGFLIFWLVRDW
jgi:hypothetical protein